MTFSGSGSRRVMTLAASWLPRTAQTRIPASRSRASCLTKKRPVLKSCQSPSYTSPARSSASTRSSRQWSTRFTNARRVATRRSALGAPSYRSSPRSGLSRWMSAAWTSFILRLLQGRRPWRARRRLSMNWGIEIRRGAPGSELLESPDPAVEVRAFSPHLRQTDALRQHGTNGCLVVIREKPTQSCRGCVCARR